MIPEEDKIIPLSVFYNGTVENLFNRYCALRDNFATGSPLWNQIAGFAGIIQNPLIGINPEVAARLNQDRLTIAQALPAAMMNEWRGLVNETVALFRPFGSLSEQDRAELLERMTGEMPNADTPVEQAVLAYYRSTLQVSAAEVLPFQAYLSSYHPDLPSAEYQRVFRAFAALIHDEDRVDVEIASRAGLLLGYERNDSVLFFHFNADRGEVVVRAIDGYGNYLTFQDGEVVPAPEKKREMHSTYRFDDLSDFKPGILAVAQERADEKARLAAVKSSPSY